MLRLASGLRRGTVARNSTMPRTCPGVAFDRAIEVLLWGLLCWLPFAYGGVLPLSHQILVGGVAAMALLYAVRTALWPSGGVVAWSFVPLALFVGLVALQMAPGTAGLGAGNLRWWQEGLQPPLLEPFAPPLSLDPAATASDFRLLAALGVLFFLSVQVLRDRAALRRLLVAVAVIGAAVAAVGVLQNLTGADSLLWLRKAPGGRATAGPFVHYGHFSQFLNLAVGAGLGLLLLRVAERDRRDRYAIGDLVQDLGAPERRLDVFLFGFVVLAVVAICLSRSRNGVLSMLLAGAGTAALLHRTGFLRGIGWSFVGLLVAAFGVLLLVGFDPVYERLQTLEDQDLYSFRLAIAADALRAFAEFPWLGAGQGSFAEVFPLFDTAVRPGRAENAENQYIELLVETGVVGFALVMLFVAAVVGPWLRRLRSRREGADGALFGLGFGVLAVAIHATSDFGLRIPAVATLTVVCLGAVVARTGAVVAPGPGWRLGAAGVAFLGAVGLGALLPGLERDRIAHAHVEAARGLANRIEAAVEAGELLRLRQRERGHWAAAIEAAPRHADHQVAYANAAWQSLVATEWAANDPAAAALPAAATARLAAAARLVQQALLETRRLCAVRGDLWCLVGQLGVEWLDDPAAARWIERGYRLAPENPTTCLAWARQLLKVGDDAAAVPVFVRALRMGAPAHRVLPAIAREFAAPGVALAVARHEVRWLQQLVAAFRRDAAADAWWAGAQAELLAELERLAGGEQPPAWGLAALADCLAEAGRSSEAIGLYRRHLAIVPLSGVRLSLARLLQASGDLVGARAEVRRFLNYNPGHAGAKRLLAELGM